VPNLATPLPAETGAIDMRGDTKVIEYLNAVLKGELTAVSQYWLHYRLLDNLGIKKLADYERHESIDEMKHADELMERIFFLDGLPGMQQLNRLRIGETLEEVLQADLELEHDAVALLKDAIEHCEKVRDYPSRDLFARILAAEEEHVDFIETQQSMIKQMGLANYIQLQSEPAGS
jgi:bacterioferritin